MTPGHGVADPPAGIRFAPPAVEIPAELGWLLAAAFARQGPGPPAGDAVASARLAALFDLGPRIVARHGGRRVRGWLGAAAEGLVRAHRRAVVLALPAESQASRLAGLAARLEQPIVFLKGFALQRLAPGPQGARPFVDLDALVPAAAAGGLRELLLADGWQSAADGANPHHLPPLTAPGGMAVDLHFRLRGVRVAEERWATAGELVAAGLCRPLAELAESAWLPAPPLLAAHLAAHAIEQHGLRPATYPLLRAAADLADLSAIVPPGALAEGAWPLVRESLAEAELVALFRLGEILVGGRLPQPQRSEEEGAALLLRHVVAGALDPDYRRSLAVDHAAGRLRQARREGRLMRYIAAKLVVPAEAVGPVSRWRALGRRLAHPFQLGGRLASATAARLRRVLSR